MLSIVCQHITVISPLCQAHICRKNMINGGYNFYLLILPKFIPEMKKIVIGIVVLALAAFAVDKFFFTKKNPVADEPKQQALAVSKNSAAFNESFDKLL